MNLTFKNIYSLDYTMTLNLIGLGLSTKSISAQALETTKSSDKIYLEEYTVDFPYNIKELKKQIKKKITPLNREQIESEEILKQAKKQNISLLIYGDSLSATTHIQLIISAKKQKIPYKIIHSESILTAIAESGLQLYKFGKTTSLPKFQKNFKPNSWVDIIIKNQKIKAHTLILTDIGLTSKQAIEQLEQTSKKRKIKLDKIIICSQLGHDSKIYYDKLEKLKDRKIKQPFCIIIPSDFHFIEEETLNILKEK